MAERSWGLITSGAAFEALATTLVFFEDQSAALFGRRGKDGGQDARSGDGTLVYQAKHHENESAALAIKDALGEADKIEKYRTAGHPRHAQWKSVTRWRLATNAVFNPTDRQNWDKEVVPRFAKLKLKADYWERANLDGLLDKHPEVDRSFFQNEVRAFLSLPEVRERAADEEPFLRRAATNTFVGRDDEVRNVRSFLGAEQRFMVVHGAGGVGKTRLLLEAGEEIAVEDGWQVLWANVATLSMTGTWFDAIVPERKTVLFLDDPEEPKLVQVLAEQLGPRVGRTAQWKVVLSVPSPRDPVLKYLPGPRMAKQVQELVVGDLATKDAVSMCRELLDGIGNKAEHERLATEISKRFSCHPIWMTLAVHLLERHGDWARVPETSEDLARAYLKEVIDEQNEFDPQAVEAVLRWIALLGPVNREDDLVLQSIADRTIADPTALLALVARLIQRRALIERGARRRLVELKPDVLRDRLLLDWLTTNVGFGHHPFRPSTDATKLATEVVEAVQTGAATNVHRATLVALARSELLLLLSGKNVELLAPVFEGIEKALDAISASRRVELVELLEPIAPFRPRLIVELIRALVSKPPPVEQIESPFGAREVGPTSVALRLAWLASHAALGARDDEVSLVLETLCSLAVVESEIEMRVGGLPNDGKRALGQVQRVLEGGPQFLSSYDGAARTVALRLIDALSKVAPSDSQRTIIEAVALPMVSIERMQSWNSETAFHWRRFVIEPGSEAWTTRAEVLARVQTLLRDGTVPAATRLLLWKLVVEAHGSVNRSELPTKKGAHPMRGALLETLQWAKQALTARPVDVEELKAARRLWEWHAKYEKDPELKQEAIALEGLYRANDVAAEFEKLFAWDKDYDAVTRRQVDKAAELAAGDVATIDSFIERGLRFLGGELEIRRLLGVAFQLGRLQHAVEAVQTFVAEALRATATTPRLMFAIEVFAGWVFAVRTADRDRAVTLIQEWLRPADNDRNRVALLSRVFQGYSPRGNWCTAAEEVFLRGQAQLFLSCGQGVDFIVCAAPSFECDLIGYKAALEWMLDRLPPDQLTPGLIVLIQRLDSEMMGAKSSGGNIRDVTRWLFDQVLRVANLDDLGGNTKWHLDQLVERGGRADAQWLLDALRHRKAIEEADTDSRLGGVGHSVNLGDYVETLKPGQESDDETLRVVGELLDLSNDTGSIGYKLPDILHELDPDGIIVPTAIAGRVQQARGYDELWKVSRLTEAYVVGTAQWRTIATAVIAASSGVTDRERRSIFHQLGDPGPTSWSGTPGEVAPAFLSAVAHAEAMRDRESDEILRPYWDWYVAVAEESLRNEQERVKEERGE